MNKQCGTCAHLKKRNPEDVSGWCFWSLEQVPIWVHEAAGYGYNDVIETEGDDCDCWCEATPSKGVR